MYLKKSKSIEQLSQVKSHKPSRNQLPPRSRISKKKSANELKDQFTSRNGSLYSSEIGTSFMRMDSIRTHNHNEIDNYSLGYFKEKYTPIQAQNQQIVEDMETVLRCKENEIEALKIYRDQLKFMSFNSPYSAPVKLNMNSLKDKASVESQIAAHRQQLQNSIQSMSEQSQILEEYRIFLTAELEQYGQVIDFQKQEAMMVSNTNLEIEHIYHEIEQEQRKNSREIRHMHERIRQLTVNIKIKEDKLKDVKEKLCILSMKSNNRNNPLTHRNLSLSAKKFNFEHHQAIKSIYIGNVPFKSSSKQVIEKVQENSELTYLRFYTKKDNFTFQCIYKDRQGFIHSPKTHKANNGNIPGTNKSIEQQYESQHEIQIRHLFSMKFFSKSRIVGVECRVKTEQGNKHIKIGNCTSYLQNSLLAFSNRKLLTLGSHWHSREMIGVSIWFSDLHALAQQQKMLEKTKLSKKYLIKSNRPTCAEYYA